MSKSVTQTAVAVNGKSKSILELSESDIDEKMAKDNNNLDPETIDGFDFDTAEEFLLYHSRTGNLKVVEKLLLLMDKNEIELDINCKGKQKSNNGWTPLHLASYFGHITIIKELLKHNVDVNVINESGDTPLHKAAYTAREDIVVLLVANNADVFIINGEGLTPRELACKESVKRILIVAEEADMKKREDKFLSAARNGDIETMTSLLNDTSYPLSINCRDESGNTALHCAAYRGQKEVAMFLMKNGIDASIKNKRGQIASTLAPNVLMKQLLQKVQPLGLISISSKPITRFEGPLAKKGRFLGWRLVWAVLERGVFSLFASLADATTGSKRKGYKYLGSAMVEVFDRDEATFAIYFNDRSRAILSLPKAKPSPVDRQKWVNAVNEHIIYGTNFVREGTRFDESDEDKLADLMPIGSMQAMIQTAQAHQTILAKHIKALLQLSDDINGADKQLQTIESDPSHNNNTVNSLAVDLLHSSLPSLKFHLNLILESSNNTSSALSQCMAVFTHQDNVRQLLLKQEQDKVRVLEDALQALAREHHELEKSVVNATADHATTTNATASNSIANSVTNSMSIYQTPPRTQSICLSDTDISEYFDAFDEEEVDAATYTDSAHKKDFSNNIYLL